MSRTLTAEEAVEKALRYVFQLSNKDYRKMQAALTEVRFIQALEQDGYTICSLAEQRRLAQAILDYVDWDSDDVNGFCRYCHAWFTQEGHSYDCVAVVARVFFPAEQGGTVTDIKEG